MTRKLTLIIFPVLFLLFSGVKTACADWETVSVKSNLFVDRGNFERTEFGGEAKISGKFVTEGNSLLTAKIDLDKFEGENKFSEEWKIDLSQQILSEGTWNVLFGSFIEADDRGLLDSRYGFGLGGTRKFSAPSFFDTFPAIDVFYERENRKFESPDGHIAIRLALEIKPAPERNKLPVNPSFKTSLVVPLHETDDWRSENEFFIEHPLKAGFSLNIGFSLKHQNRPTIGNKKSDSSLKIGLGFTKQRKEI